MTLWEVAGELSRRLTSIFLRDEAGRRPVLGISRSFRPTRIARPGCCFTSTSTGIPEQALAPAIRPGGQCGHQLMQQSGDRANIPRPILPGPG